MLGPRVVEAVSGWQSPIRRNGNDAQCRKRSRSAGRRCTTPPWSHSRLLAEWVISDRAPASPLHPPICWQSEAKPLKGKSEVWTANPGNQMRPKKCVWRHFQWINMRSLENYKEFIDATGYRPPFVEEEWADDGWNWADSRIPEGTEDHPVVLVVGMMQKPTVCGRENAFPQSRVATGSPR